MNTSDFSDHRWTLDIKADFELISTIYEYIYRGKHDFFIKEILEVFTQHPELINIIHILKKIWSKKVDSFEG